MAAIFQLHLWLLSLSISATMRLLNLPEAAALALLSATTTATAQKVLDLGTAQWMLSSSIHNISVPGSVPSQAHLDLYSAGVIPDPYFGLGDFDLRWVAETNWTYSTTLDGL
jgi:beta-mannosidase